MKVVLKRRLPKGRVPHRPTKVVPVKVRYDRKRAKRSVRDQLKAEEGAA